MSFSYDNNLSATKDQLRFLVQDTTEAGHFLEDEEISFISGQELNLNRAAAKLCRAIAAKINKLPGFKDKQQFDPEKKAQTYLELARNYDDEADRSGATSLSGDAFAANVNSSGDGSCGKSAFTRDLHISN